jgi:hypothetical protein
MAVDYLILKDCKVKEQLTPDQLIATIKDRNRAYQVRDMLANSGKSQDEIDNFEFTFQKMTPNGIENSKHKISDLIAQTAILDTLSPICSDCPVANGKPFGCLGAVNYPISAKCENWLADIAFDSYKKGVVYSMMLTFILDQKVSGKETDDARRHGDTFFELKKPVEIVLSKGFFSKKAVNTSQLIDMVLGTRVMKFTHMNHLLMLFGGVFVDDTKPTDRPSKFNKDQNKYMYLGLDLPKDADKSIHDFYNLFQQIFLTMVNDVEIEFDR